MKECERCGYVTRNDEVARQEPPNRCPECGNKLKE